MGYCVIQKYNETLLCQIYIPQPLDQSSVTGSAVVQF